MRIIRITDSLVALAVLMGISVSGIGPAGADTTFEFRANNEGGDTECPRTICIDPVALRPFAASITVRDRAVTAGEANFEDVVEFTFTAGDIVFTLAHLEGPPNKIFFSPDGNSIARFESFQFLAGVGLVPVSLWQFRTGDVRSTSLGAHMTADRLQDGILFRDTLLSPSAFADGVLSVRRKSVNRMYWADAQTQKIQRANLDGTNLEDVVITGPFPLGLGLDVAGGKIYWSEVGPNMIRRANFDGTGIEDLVGSVGSRTIALDLAGGKMYWADAFVGSKIQRANLDGTGVQDLVTFGDDRAGIALDVAGGTMYWTVRTSTRQKIQRANLDGTGVVDLVTGLVDPRQIALDTAASKMYWADAQTRKIQRANLDGSGVEDLVTGLINPHGMALDVAGGKMYWTDFGADKVQRANFDGTSVEDLVMGLGNPVEIELVFESERPGAVAGPDLQLECVSVPGAIAILDGSASTDADSTPGTNDDIVSFEWFEDFSLPTRIFLGKGELLSVSLPLGAHIITLRVTDSAGATDTDEVVVTVVDTTPPVISTNLAPALLWPPNHRILDVVASVSASDLCSSAFIVLQAVTSSEPDDALGAGDGSTVDDIQGAEAESMDVKFQLRAERSGLGNGRTYFATYRAMDASGNATIATALAIVPHSIDGVSEPLPILAFNNDAGTVVQWPDVAGAQFYSVVRGKVQNIHERAGSYHLGTLTCIASVTTETSTAGSEDPEVPPLGEAFFYLFRIRWGTERDGYGRARNGLERIPSSGDCS